jgi:endonuclease YncB( thermonuclease family)
MINVRLNGINTPEIRTHPDAAYAARNRAFELMTGLTIKEGVMPTRQELRMILNTKNFFCTVIALKHEKYGRVLAEVFGPRDINITTQLIVEGLGVKYDGSKVAK